MQIGTFDKPRHAQVCWGFEQGQNSKLAIRSICTFSSKCIPISLCSGIPGIKGR